MTSLRRFKPYPAYNDTAGEWLGEIPAHWTVAPLYSRYEVALGKMLDASRISGNYLRPYLRNVGRTWRMVFPSSREATSRQNVSALIGSTGRRSRSSLDT